MDGQRKLNVAYGADDGYAKFLGVSMMSLFQRNGDFDRIHVYVLDCGITEDNREKILEIGREYGRDITFLSVEKILRGLGLNLTKNSIAIASYSRLFLADLLPQEVERILYLDCDTIVCDSLMELWEWDLKDALVGGVRDTVDEYYRKIIGLKQDMSYLNAGVLLIHIKLWREENIKGEFLEFIRGFNGAVPHHDQGIINGVAAGRKAILPLRYNMMSNGYAFSAKTVKRMYFLDSYYTEEERNKALDKPAIIHFTPGIYGRPWEENSNHPAKDEYLSVFAMSPWSNVPLKPNSLKRSVKIFAAFYRLMPRIIFESIYRLYSRISHR